MNFLCEIEPNNSAIVFTAVAVVIEYISYTHSSKFRILSSNTETTMAMMTILVYLILLVKVFSTNPLEVSESTVLVPKRTLMTTKSGRH